MSDERRVENNLTTIILAAGKGTRMKSKRAKVLHEVFFAPMFHHVVRAVLPVGAKKNIAVVGHQADQVRESLAEFPVTCVLQQEQKGTGHAVLSVEEAVPDQCDTILILCGDTPLVCTSTLAEMCAAHTDKNADVTLLTTMVDDPFGYGRIMQDAHGRVLAIVEEKDASDEERRIREINGGLYCVRRDFLFQALREITPDNHQGELYLTDIVGRAVESGMRVERFMHQDASEILGVNSRAQLAQAHRVLSLRRNSVLMDEGVTLLDPSTTYVSPEVVIGADTVLHPQVQLMGGTVVGENAIIGSFSNLSGCTVKAGVLVPVGTVASNRIFGGKG